MMLKTHNGGKVPYLKGKIHILRNLIDRMELFTLFEIGVNDEFKSLAENIS